MITNGLADASTAHAAESTAGVMTEQIDLSNHVAAQNSSCGPATDAGHIPTGRIPNPGPINTLPNEIVSHILGYLDIPKSSSAFLLDEPRFDLTESNIADLKSTSCVSKQWRRAVFPMLFKHARFIVPEPEYHRPEYRRQMLDYQIRPFLDFASRTSLRDTVVSFTLVVQDSQISANRRKGLDPFWSFWISVFEVIDPSEVLIVALAEALGALTACHVALADAWQFDCPCHYLQLKRSLPFSKKNADNPSDQEPDTSVGNSISGGKATADLTPADSPTVLQIRPWSDLLLNEGSSIRAYATYEWWQRQPPSILSDLVGADRPDALISPTVRNMEYIGVFPISSHFNCLAKYLPRLDRLYTQIVPRNDILHNPVKMNQVEAEDLWMERNACYASLMREIFNAPPIKNYKHLKIFESGDAADRDAWEMAIEFVRRAGNGWKVESDGVFTRDPKDIMPGHPEDGEPSLLSV